MASIGLNSLKVSRLLAFKSLSLEFCPGITVLIGENATGKTQVLKIVYGLLESLREHQREPLPSENSAKPPVTRKLLNLFRPDDDQIGRLVHREVGRRQGSATLTFGADGKFQVRITSLGKVTMNHKGVPPHVIYIPSREVLSIYPGFISAYENRELSFDETYYDLCKSLSAAQLRGPRAEQANELIKPLLRVLGGRVALKGERFVLQSREGNLEAPLLAEGLRKIATIAHLVANGSLTAHSVLLWDEPEANLNPTLVTVISNVLQTLAASGVQIVIATHDFLLSQELSLAAEYQTEPNTPLSFIALSRTGPNRSIVAQSGATLPDLSENPILAEFAAHYDREMRLSSGHVSSGRGNGRRRNEV